VWRKQESKNARKQAVSKYTSFDVPGSVGQGPGVQTEHPGPTAVLFAMPLRWGIAWTRLDRHASATRLDSDSMMSRRVQRAVRYTI
jgi:hypothetical protein